MLFNSFEFPFFLSLVFVTYYVTPSRFRWVLLLLASYYFYGSWKPEYVFLLAGSTLVDYLCALRMEKQENAFHRKCLLAFSITVNLSILVLFKYANFFSENTRALLSDYSFVSQIPEFDWILPIGISFYTLQTIGYSIDVYRKRRSAERHLGKFALYVSFFPQLVAGPIERSTKLLPQFSKEIALKVENVTQGIWLILWGFFKKLVISDHLSTYIDPVYANPSAHHPITLILATYMVLYRMYCDFSGYTDIARGSALLFGINLSKNFDRPYSATNIREFWQRWHISLTQWMFAYLYKPLVNKRKHLVWLQTMSLILVFVLVGFWHGASWNFIIFGLYYGILIVTGDFIERTLKSKSQHSNIWKVLTRIWQNKFLGFLLTFHAIWLACIFFTLPTVIDAASFLGALTKVNTSIPIVGLDFTILIAISGIIVMEVVQWIQSKPEVGLTLQKIPLFIRWSLLYSLIFSILMFGNFNSNPFIYFQF